MRPAGDIPVFSDRPLLHRDLDAVQVMHSGRAGNDHRGHRAQLERIRLVGGLHRTVGGGGNNRPPLQFGKVDLRDLCVALGDDNGRSDRREGVME